MCILDKLSLTEKNDSEAPKIIKNIPNKKVDLFGNKIIAKPSIIIIIDKNVRISFLSLKYKKAKKVNKHIINNITKCLPRSLKGKNLAEIIHEIDYKKFHSPSKRPRNQYFLPKLGPCFKGYLLSGSAGRFTGNQLMQLADQVEEIKITPWKALFAEKTTRKPNLKFLSKNNDFLLKVSHCSGQPYCKQALVDTSKLANGINKRLKYKYKSKVIDAPNIHISGCDKNCGIPKNVSIIIRKFKKNNQATVIGGAHKKLVHELLLELK